MIKFENTETMNFKNALRGMRNPLNSWDKSDSGYSIDLFCKYCNTPNELCAEAQNFIIGEKDMELCKKLIKGGSPHRKFLRQIMVSVDITAPLYWWKEFDTYKVGTVADSCSTMHTIHKKDLGFDDFSCEHLLKKEMEILGKLIDMFNAYAKEFSRTKDKAYWWQIIQLLPSSYNQKRTVSMNYEVLLNICRWRSNHKLDEWVEFCKWCDTLPYFKEFRECING